MTINNCYILVFWASQLSALVGTYLPIAFARQPGKLFSRNQLDWKDKRKLLPAGTLSPVTRQIEIVLKTSNHTHQYIHPLLIYTKYVECLKAHYC